MLLFGFRRAGRLGGMTVKSRSYQIFEIMCKWKCKWVGGMGVCVFWDLGRCVEWVRAAEVKQKSVYHRFQLVIFQVCEWLSGGGKSKSYTASYPHSYFSNHVRMVRMGSCGGFRELSLKTSLYQNQ